MCRHLSDVNKSPEANAGLDVVVYLPNRAAELDGSQSSDDHGIVEYEWARDPKSPAAGVSSEGAGIGALPDIVFNLWKKGDLEGNIGRREGGKEGRKEGRKETFKSQV